MARVKVTCEISEYSDTAKPNIRVHSHWNISDFVELEIEGKRYTVSGKQLKIAIDNCMNTGF